MYGEYLSQKSHFCSILSDTWKEEFYFAYFAGWAVSFFCCQENIIFRTDIS